MQLFQCPACQQRLFFSNLACSCGQQIVFDPQHQTMTVAQQNGCTNRALIGGERPTFRALPEVATTAAQMLQIY